MRIAFYAPLKSPHHPVPSGDRKIARLFMTALTQAGHLVELASELRCWTPEPTTERYNALKQQSNAEAETLLTRWRAAPATRPDLWFTYHPYYKAPDWIGPKIAQALAIPYVTAEASFAAKRNRDSWAQWQGDVVEALGLAALNICMTPIDREALESLLGKGRIASLAPFIDVDDAAAAGLAPFPVDFATDMTTLVTVAMMRPGDKLKSYQMLGAVLSGMTALPWRLAIVGDGAERLAVEHAFRQLPAQRVAFCGEARPEAVAAHLAAADIYVWPGFGEAYGLAYLEAQLAGLPVIAQRAGGIASVVEDGKTGILTPPGDHAAFAAALAALVSDPARRKAMGKAAHDFVRSERALAPASARLDAMLRRIGETPTKGTHKQ